MNEIERTREIDRERKIEGRKDWLNRDINERRSVEGGFVTISGGGTRQRSHPSRTKRHSFIRFLLYIPQNPLLLTFIQSCKHTKIVVLEPTYVLSLFSCLRPLVGSLNPTFPYISRYIATQLPIHMSGISFRGVSADQDARFQKYVGPPPPTSFSRRRLFSSPPRVVVVPIEPLPPHSPAVSTPS